MQFLCMHHPWPRKMKKVGGSKFIKLDCMVAMQILSCTCSMKIPCSNWVFPSSILSNLKMQQTFWYFWNHCWYLGLNILFGFRIAKDIMNYIILWQNVSTLKLDNKLKLWHGSGFIRWPQSLLSGLRGRKHTYVLSYIALWQTSNVRACIVRTVFQGK